LEKQTSLTALKNLPGLTRARMAPMKGSPEDSLVYCSKQDVNPFVKGTLPEPGKRNDLHVACDMVKEGRPIQQIAEEVPTTVVRYHKGLIYLRSLLLEGRRDKPVVFWLHGATGTGKTRSAVEFGSIFERFWMSSCNLKWYDGYDGQPVAIFDDIRDDSVNFNTLLRLLDRYCLSVEYKGGFHNWIPKFIVVTCPVDPGSLFSYKPKDDIGQLLRRIDHIVDFDANPYDVSKPNVLTRLLEQPTEPNNDNLTCHEVIDLTNDVEEPDVDATQVMSISDAEDSELDLMDDTGDVALEQATDALMQDDNNECGYSHEDLFQARLNTSLGAFNTHTADERKSEMDGYRNRYRYNVSGYTPSKFSHYEIVISDDEEDKGND